MLSHCLAISQGPSVDNADIMRPSKRCAAASRTCLPEMDEHEIYTPIFRRLSLLKDVESPLQFHPTTIKLSLPYLIHCFHRISMSSLLRNVTFLVIHCLCQPLVHLNSAVKVTKNISALPVYCIRSELCATEATTG